MTPRKPVVRAVKARRRSRVACGCWLQVGTYIIRGPDGRSKCAACVISSLQAAERALRLPAATNRGGPGRTNFPHRKRCLPEVSIITAGIPASLRNSCECRSRACMS
jgi:hypothetical protein